ncbi:uncharacterized protein LOC114534542 [Dendronephthya gigantea]|uniref:uncharacterized protein LOC114534542 n=1 Tax=Dendronephthya gigantea TaxID=151771 RepID=UPI00106DAB95|nr:uncharacterized protein LOC114534542 [Dendronephthya gigantea]
MPELITGVLGFALRITSKKARSYVAKKLKHGGLTAQKFRGLIISKLDKINSTLDDMKKLNLRMSISRFKLGMDHLYPSFDKTSEGGNISTADLASGKPFQEITAQHLESKIERFPELAKECFEAAEKYASKAFQSASLSIEERILASELRIASEMLAREGKPEDAAKGCLRSLQELHEMPEIEAVVSVYLKGGVKAFFKKDTRAEVVKALKMINLILADFISKNANAKKSMSVFDWPMIKCGSKQFVSFISLYCDDESSLNPEEMKTTLPWDISPETLIFLDFPAVKFMISQLAALSKNGDLVCFSESSPCCPQKLDKTTGEMKPYRSSSLEDKTILPFGVVVDEDDQVHLVSFDGTLSVFSEDGRNIHQRALTFLKPEDIESLKSAAITVTKDKSIVIACGHWQSSLKSIVVYICNKDGEVTKFNTGLSSYTYKVKSLTVNCDNEVIIVTYKWPDLLFVLYVFTEKGELRKSVKVRHSKNDFFNNDVFYDDVSKTIIGYAWSNDGKVLIEYWSGETGKLLYSYLLLLTTVPDDLIRFHLVCNKDGGLVLVGPRHVIFVKHSS